MEKSVCIVPMTLSKETKGTFVYAADDPDAAITTLYVRRSAMPKGASKNISVAINVIG